MKITKEIFENIKDDSRELVRQYLIDNGIEVITEYGHYTTELGLEVVKKYINNNCKYTYCPHCGKKIN